MITSFFSPKPKKGGSRPTATDEGNGGDGSKRERIVTPQDGENDDEVKNEPCSSHNNKRHKTAPTAALFRHPSSSSVGTNRPLCPETEELLSHLCVDAPVDEDISAPTWRQALQRHVTTPGFGSLAKFVASERAKGKTIYPPPADVFSALNLTPLHRVKVVIVGQDPYHSPNQGHGLAFSVRRGIAIPPSLRNIYKELANDNDVSFPSSNGGAGPPRMPTHGNLENWARQGVLMLNTVLTVRGGEANSHKNRGWEAFTDECIRIIDRESRAGPSSSSGKRGIVFLLWGKPASKKAEGVISKSGGHTIICTSHPSPLGASKTNSPFLGSKCFSRANDALRERGLEPIDWNVD